MYLYFPDHDPLKCTEEKCETCRYYVAIWYKDSEISLWRNCPRGDLPNITWEKLEKWKDVQRGLQSVNLCKCGFDAVFDTEPLYTYMPPCFQYRKSKCSKCEQLKYERFR